MSLSERRDISKRKGEEMDETHHQKSSIFSHLTVTGSNSSSSWQKKGHEGGKGRKRYPLMSFWELPEYMKDNEYILNYYRANWPLKEALFSVFRWHNETLNVWTHLIGFLLFLGLTVMNLMQVPHVADLFGLFTGCLSSSSYTNVSRTFKDMFVGTTILIDLKQPSKMETSSISVVLGTSRWPFFVFLAGSMFCLLSSSICHLFCCHSHSLNLFLVRIDYVGIVVMIITSFFPQIYYIFQCEPLWQIVYLGGITVMGLFTIATLLSPILSTNKFRAFRASLFCSMGLFGIVPAIHAVIVNWGNPRRNVTLAYESAMALSYLTGAWFYVTRIPERWKPGWFDLAGHSHQIFHVLVVMGALAHYVATLVMLEWRNTSGCDN